MVFYHTDADIPDGCRELFRFDPSDTTAIPSTPRPRGYAQLLPVIHRQNKTWRPERRSIYTESPIFHLHRCGSTNCTSAFVFVKFYDPTAQIKMRSLGSLHVYRNSLVSEICPALRRRAKLATNVSLELYEDVNLSRVDKLHIHNNFHANDINTGDIIVCQKATDAVKYDKVFTTIPQYGGTLTVDESASVSQEEQEDLFSHMRSLWSEQTFSDVTIVCEHDGTEYPTHRAILCRNPYFKAILRNSNRECLRLTIPEEYPPDIVKVALEHIYVPSQAITLTDPATILKMISLADFIAFDNLRDACIDAFSFPPSGDKLLSEVALDAVKISTQLSKCEALKTKALVYILGNYIGVAKTIRFGQLAVQEPEVYQEVVSAVGTVLGKRADIGMALEEGS